MRLLCSFALFERDDHGHEHEAHILGNILHSEVQNHFCLSFLEFRGTWNQNLGQLSLIFEASQQSITSTMRSLDFCWGQTAAVWTPLHSWKKQPLLQGYEKLPGGFSQDHYKILSPCVFIGTKIGRASCSIVIHDSRKRIQNLSMASKTSWFE